MFSYTSFLSIPVLVFLFYLFDNSSTWSIPVLTCSLSTNTSMFFSLLLFLSFSVKLPLFGLHYWLPMAHVEAPTFGRVILASMLLKLGGVGLLRFSQIVDFTQLSGFFLSYLILFSVIATLVCCFQSDFKRLIAYSSVAHMMLIPMLVVSSNSLSYPSCIIVIVFHGLSSRGLFLIVGYLYYMYSTRQLTSLRGLLNISPLFSLLVVGFFLFTISAPPFPSFIGELFSFMSLFPLSCFVIFMCCFYTFLVIVYNVIWLVAVLIGNSSHLVASYSFYSYSIFLQLSCIFLFMLPVIFIFSFFFFVSGF